MTHLFLIRHARSTWNAEGRMQGQADPPLDEAGREQARALVAQLQPETFHAIYSSPLARARETAEIIAAPRGLAIRFDDRLKERHLGEWTGLTGDEVNERFPDRVNGNWRVGGPPGGENNAALIARASAAFADIFAAHPEEAVAVVSHGSLLTTYVGHLLGVPHERHVIFSFPNASVARFKVLPDRVIVLALG
jgi:broad specificity phosphatase PhoE